MLGAAIIACLCEWGRVLLTLYIASGPLSSLIDNFWIFSHNLVTEVMKGYTYCMSWYIKLIQLCLCCFLSCLF